MSKEADIDMPPEADEAADGTPLPKKRNKKKLILIALAVLLLLGGGELGAWHFLGAASDQDKLAAEEADMPEEFVDVPAMQVALRGADGGSRMLKLHVMLVPGDKTPEEIEPRLPLLVDRYQPFLRELRPEDMAGSAATFRIKEELLIRANQALGQGAVRDVLIQDLMQS